MSEKENGVRGIRTHGEILKMRHALFDARKEAYFGSDEWYSVSAAHIDLGRVLRGKRAQVKEVQHWLAGCPDAGYDLEAYLV